MTSTTLPLATLLVFADLTGTHAAAQTHTADSVSAGHLPRWGVGLLITTGMDPRYTMEPGLEEQHQKETSPTLRAEVGRRLHRNWWLLAAWERGVQRHGGAYDLELVPNTSGIWFASPIYTCDLLAVEHTTNALQLSGGWTFMPKNAYSQATGNLPFMSLDLRAGFSVLHVQAKYRAAGLQTIEEPGSSLYSPGVDAEEEGLGAEALLRWDRLERVGSETAWGLGMVFALRLEMRLVKQLTLVTDLGGQVGLVLPQFAGAYHAPTDEFIPAHRLNPGSLVLGGGLRYQF